MGVCTDNANNLYISTSGAVRKVNLSTGIITTFAGNNTPGYSGDGGPATDAQVGGATGIVAAPNGDIYFSDLGHLVRKVAASTGIITTIAGTGVAGYSGDGGPATNAMINYTQSIAINSLGELFIPNGQVIRKIDVAGTITTVAGTGTYAYTGDGGPATAASMFSPCGIGIDGNDNIYVSDVTAHVVRKINAATGIITTIAGKGTAGYSGDGGPATAAQMNFPWGLHVNSTGDILYIAARDNNRIRKVYLPGAGINEVGMAPAISIYPNPSAGMFTLHTHITGGYEVVICNVLGQRLHHAVVNGPQWDFNLSHLSPGIYYASIVHNGARQTERIVIVH